MESNDSSDLPVPNDLIEYWTHVLAELLPATDWKFIGHVAGKDVRLIEEARSPVRAAIVRVLPPRLPTGAGSIRAAPAGAEVARRIAHALRPGVGDLSLQAILHALLQHGLKGIVFLIGIGHVGSGDRIGATQSGIVGKIYGVGGIRTGVLPAKKWTWDSGNDQFTGLRNLTGGVQTFQLCGIHEVQQVRTVLADIADLRGQRVAELVLNGEVPLLVHGRPYVLVRNPYPDSLIAGKVDRGATRRRCIASRERTADGILPDNSKWRV